MYERVHNFAPKIFDSRIASDAIEVDQMQLTFNWCSRDFSSIRLTSSCSLVGSGDLSGTSSPSGSSYGSSSITVWYILQRTLRF